MNEAQQNPPQVHVKIRSMNGMFSTAGIELVGDDPLAPKLLPLEIVAIPMDHPIFDLEGSRHLEVTREPTTRPLFFNSLQDVATYRAQDAEHQKRIVSAIAQIGSSQEQSARIRAENKLRRDELIQQGINPDPVQPAMVDFMNQDRHDGLQAPSASNALGRDDDGNAVHPEDNQTVQQEIIAPPSNRSRRGRRVKSGG